VQLYQDSCGLFILHTGRWVVTLCEYDSPSMDFAILSMSSGIVVDGGCIENARFTLDELKFSDDRFRLVFFYLVDCLTYSFWLLSSNGAPIDTQPNKYWQNLFY